MLCSSWATQEQHKYVVSLHAYVQVKTHQVCKQAEHLCFQVRKNGL